MIVFHTPSPDVPAPVCFDFDDMFSRGKIYRGDSERIEEGLCAKAIDVQDRIDAGIVYISRMTLMQENNGGMLVGRFQTFHFRFLSGIDQPHAAHSKKKSGDTQYVKQSIMIFTHFHHSFFVYDTENGQPWDLRRLPRSLLCFIPLQQPTVEPEVGQNRQGHDARCGDEEHPQEEPIQLTVFQATFCRIGRQRQRTARR